MSATGGFWPGEARRRPSRTRRRSRRDGREPSRRLAGAATRRSEPEPAPRAGRPRQRAGHAELRWPSPSRPRPRSRGGGGARGRARGARCPASSTSPTASPCSRARRRARTAPSGSSSARFNGEISNRLLESALEALDGGGRRRGADHRHAGAGRVRAPDRRDGAREDAPLLVRDRARLRGARRDGRTSTTSRARRRRASSSPGSRRACRWRSASSPWTRPSRRRSGSTRAPTPRARRSRWPTSSRRCAQPGDEPRQRLGGVGYPGPPMSKVCAVCGKKPGFGNHRSHSMVATKRRFEPNLQRVRVAARRQGHAGVRLHALPQGRQGPEGALALAAFGTSWTTRAARRSASGRDLGGDLAELGVLRHLGSRVRGDHEIAAHPVAVVAEPCAPAGPTGKITTSPRRTSRSPPRVFMRHLAVEHDEHSSAA